MNGICFNVIQYQLISMEFKGSPSSWTKKQEPMLLPMKYCVSTQFVLQPCVGGPTNKEPESAWRLTFVDISSVHDSLQVRNQIENCIFNTHLRSHMLPPIRVDSDPLPPLTVRTCCAISWNRIFFRIMAGLFRKDTAIWASDFHLMLAKGWQHGWQGE